MMKGSGELIFGNQLEEGTHGKADRPSGDASVQPGDKKTWYIKNKSLPRARKYN